MLDRGLQQGRGGNWRDNALIVTDGNRVLDMTTLYSVLYVLQ